MSHHRASKEEAGLYIFRKAFWDSSDLGQVVFLGEGCIRAMPVSGSHAGIFDFFPDLVTEGYLLKLKGASADRLVELYEKKADLTAQLSHLNSEISEFEGEFPELSRFN